MGIYRGNLLECAHVHLPRRRDGGGHSNSIGSYMLNTNSRIPEVQPHEYEYCIPPVELCSMTWMRTYSRRLYPQNWLSMNRVPYCFPRSAYSTRRDRIRYTTVSEHIYMDLSCILVRGHIQTHRVICSCTSTSPSGWWWAL